MNEQKVEESGRKEDENEKKKESLRRDILLIVLNLIDGRGTICVMQIKEPKSIIKYNDYGRLGHY